MCFSTSIPKQPPPTPMPNRQDEANQQAVQGAIKRARLQNPQNSTVLTGGMGDSGFNRDINRVTLLGRAG